MSTRSIDPRLNSTPSGPPRCAASDGPGEFPLRGASRAPDRPHDLRGPGSSYQLTPRHTDRLSGRVRRRPAESSNGRRCRVGTSTAGRVTASVRCYPRRRSRAPPGGDGARRPRRRCRCRRDPSPYPSSQGSSTTSPVARGCSPPTPTNSQRALHPTPTGRQRGDQRSLTESRSATGTPYDGHVLASLRYRG